MQYFKVKRIDFKPFRYWSRSEVIRVTGGQKGQKRSKACSVEFLEIVLCNSLCAMDLCQIWTHLSSKHGQSSALKTLMCKGHLGAIWGHFLKMCQMFLFLQIAMDLSEFWSQESFSGEVHGS